MLKQPLGDGGGDSRQGNDQYEGYCVDLLEEVSKVVGFNYTIQLVKDNKYGSKMEDGSWNGMIGELTRKVCSVLNI